jgi:hypothetical protein
MVHANLPFYINQTQVFEIGTSIRLFSSNYVPFHSLFGGSIRESKDP